MMMAGLIAPEQEEEGEEKKLVKGKGKATGKAAAGKGGKGGESAGSAKKKGNPLKGYWKAYKNALKNGEEEAGDLTAEEQAQVWL